MNAFPVLSSIIAPKELSLFIQTTYNLNSNATCSIIKTGINHTYLVESGEHKYIFRLYSFNWRSEKEILEELKFISQLKAGGVSVSYPITDKEGAYLQSINAPEGLRYGVLFSYANGEKVRTLTVQDCYQMGILLAQCHNASQNKDLKRINYDIEKLTELPYQYALKHYDSSLEEMQFIAKAGAQLKNLFQEHAKTLRHGIIHLDFWYDNMNITKDSKITLFDFDFCGNGWLILDIAYSALQLFNTEPDKNIFEQKLKNLYKGYESLIPLSDNEKVLIPHAGLAVWIYYLGVQAQRFDDWSNIFLTKNYLKHYLGLVQSWLAYNKIEL